MPGWRLQARAKVGSGGGQAAWVNENLSLFPFEATWAVTDPHVKIIGKVLS